MTFDALTLFGLLAVALMLLFYTFEDASTWCVPALPSLAPSDRFTALCRGRGRSDWSKECGRSLP